MVCLAALQQMGIGLLGQSTLEMIAIGFPLKDNGRRFHRKLLFIMLGIHLTRRWFGTFRNAVLAQMEQMYSTSDVLFLRHKYSGTKHCN